MLSKSGAGAHLLFIAFDRMVEVQPTDVPFKHPDDFDAESYFSPDSFRELLHDMASKVAENNEEEN
jgi:hypothetical protein